MDYKELGNINDSLIEEDKESVSRASSRASEPPVRPSERQPPARPSTGKKPPPMAKQFSKFNFYYKQHEKIYKSGLDIKNMAPEEIMQHLNQ